jgi:hypothetical protein
MATPMDPFTALSIATAITQFVHFAGSLVSSTSEIFDSVNGASANNLRLEDDYSKLRALGETLEAHAKFQPPLWQSQTQAQGNKSAPERDFSLVQLSAQCKADCDQVLGALAKLKVGSGGSSGKRLLRSIKASVRTAWGSRDMADLEERLQRTQRLVSLHLSSFIRYAPSPFQTAA